ncbi:enoyl-CoA hydratase/isomerase family protein [Variovorax sp. J22R115]|uniref:enoyl-CoA hydratase/isomerase family protein n=1 Tax=Variovorax sp. J22R115 TaxID=3053509 RepID=UPI00257570AF|nr:enoyl-CoA hydratase/isomerase family protein [Variovorax sp. J22R115]MDM0047443.1 enoyl-CoA hydratase/isomerase family protein [Variovorax sp. J22R115]
MIKTTWHERVAVLALDRPASLNALDPDLLDHLGAALGDVLHRGAAAVVLSGEGRAFSAGADLRWFAQRTAQGTEAQLAALSEMLEAGARVVRAILAAPVPVISAINGPCIGGAMGIALAADVALAARSAYFSLPQVPQLGIVPDLGATWLLPRVVGRPRAMAMSLFGDKITGEQAEQWGMVWQCVDDDALQAHALSTARRLAGMPAQAVIGARRLLDEAFDRSMGLQLDEEGRRQMELLMSDGETRPPARQQTHLQAP